jgi:hypothetical protein
VEDCFRGTAAIAGAPLLSFNFENCWPARLAGRIGLFAGVPNSRLSGDPVQLCSTYIPSAFGMAHLRCAAQYRK